MFRVRGIGFSRRDLRLLLLLNPDPRILNPLCDFVRPLGNVRLDTLDGSQGFGAQADAEAFGQAVELLVGEVVFLFEEEDLLLGQALGDGDGQA